MKYTGEFQDSNNNILRGLFSVIDNDKTKPIMILTHGFSLDKNMSPMPELEEKLNSKNISTFRFDFYGHGKSDGDFEDITITKGVDCVLQTIKYLISIGFKNIGLFGESFGGQCSILAASKTNKLKVLCLKSPVSDYSEVERLRRTPKILKDWKNTNFLSFTNGFKKNCRLKYSFYLDIPNHHTYQSANNIIIPTFVAHGINDTTVPPQQSKHLVTILPKGKFYIYLNTEHHYDDKEEFNKFLEESTNFIVNSFK